jgi:ATP-binding cassette, subfamily B, multidrug efflux pump
MRYMSTLRGIWPYLRRHLFSLIAGFLLLICANLFALIPPFLIGQAINDIQQRVDVSALTRYALMIVGLALITGIVAFSARFVMLRVSRFTEYEMRTDLFRKFQRLDLDYFQQRKVGDLVARATNDLSAIRMMTGPGITNLCNTIIAFTVTAIAMVRINTRLTLYTLTVMPLITVLFIVVGQGIRERYRAVQDQFGEVSARAQENFSGIRVVKAYAQETKEQDAFNRVNHEYVERSISFARLNSLLWPSMYFIAGLAAALLLWLGGSDVIAGRIELGQFVQFNTYLAALAFPMIALGWAVNLFQQGSASMSRIQEIFDATPAIADGPQTQTDFIPARGDVEFRAVSLRYGVGPEALHEISFKVPAGGSLGIVGHTGAGKSSLVNLLARVYDVTDGDVLIDGVDVRAIPLEALRRTIGYVSQETFLFSLPLEENVAFGMRRADEERLTRAVETAQLSKDLVDFPQGLHTTIGERGVTLSGGQKQRASIARAVAKDPLILVLDDALSSVDTNTEAAILEGLREVMSGRTSIVIAHRISTVKNLDQIIVMEQGRIVERGTHRELLALGGLYAAMYRRQLLSEELEVDDGETDDEDIIEPSEAAPD